MTTCIAKNCNSVKNKDCNLTFHKFPLFDPNLLKLWLENITPSNYQPKSEDHVCSLHFTNDQFMNTEPKRLIRFAVPTIFANVLQNIKTAYSTNQDQKKRSCTKRKAIAKQEEELSDSDANTTDLSVLSDDNFASEHNVTNEEFDLEKTKFCAVNARYVGDFQEEDLHSPKKMKIMWTIAYKEIAEQRSKLYSITQRNKRLEGQVTRLKNVIRHLKSVHK